MGRWLTGSHWALYATGATIGILSAIVARRVHPEGRREIPAIRTRFFFSRLQHRRAAAPEGGWFLEDPGWLFLGGIAIGAFLSAVTSGSFHLSAVPNLWSTIIGPGIPTRLWAGFTGGILIGFGAAWAGSPSPGGWLSGMMHLRVCAWVTTGCAILAAGGTALFIYHVLFL